MSPTHVETLLGAEQQEPRQSRSGTVVPATAFVDPNASSDADGRLGDPSRPFRTIVGAVRSIQGTAPLAVLPNRPTMADDRAGDLAGDRLLQNGGIDAAQWTIVAMPGVHSGDVTLPPGIGLVGAGPQTTVLAGALVVRGAARVESISIQSRTVPAVSIVFDTGTGQLAALVDVWIDAVATIPRSQSVGGSGGVPDARPSRMAVVRAKQSARVTSDTTSQVLLDRVSLTADLESSRTGVDAVISGISASGVRLVMRRVDIAMAVSPWAGLDVVSADDYARVDIVGGSVSVTVSPSAPQFDVALLTATDCGSVYQSGATTFYVLEASVLGTAPATSQNTEAAAIAVGATREGGGDDGNGGTADRRNAPRGSVYFVRTGASGVVWSSGAIVDMGTVPLGSGVLADARALSSSATLLGTHVRFGLVPPVRGNVTYVADSEGGNAIMSGGIYTNVRHLVADGPDTRLFLADNDHTLLLDGPDPPTLLLESPAVVNTQVLYAGKIVVVKNLASKASARIEGPISDTDGMPLTVGPRQAVTLQNDGLVWHIVART